MKASKRLGYIGLALVTFIASIVVQVVASAVVVIPVAFMVVFSTDAAELGGAEYMQRYNDAVTEVLPISIVVTHLLLLLTFGLWYRFGCGKPSLKNIDFKKLFAPTSLVTMLLIAVGMWGFTNFAFSLIYPAIPEGIREGYEALMESAGFGESLLPTIAAVVIAPFGEELIFRGVCFYYARKAEADFPDTIAFWSANVIQAFLFGVFHLNIVQGTYAFLLGLVLGYLVYRFKSLLPAILGHMLFNGLSSFAMEPISKIVPETNVAYAIVAGVAFVMMLAGVYLSESVKKATNKA